MYKTKLQELCQKKHWALPKYSAIKDGQDHMPSFKASVFVNGVTFTSPGAFSTSKEAQNQAAKLAFLRFYSASLGSSKATAEYDTKQQVAATKPQNIPIPAHSSVTNHIDVDQVKSHVSKLNTEEKDRLCKYQLQNYAQRNNLDPPIFTIQTAGPPHARNFKATVIVDGQSFESPGFYNTLKEAEQAAAKIALMSLSLDIYKKGDTGPFKSLLLELTQREGFCTPTYKTKQIGSPQLPTFFTTVEVEGKEFYGKASRSKKQAEHDAAKIAYIALKECGLNKYTVYSSSLGEHKPVQSLHRSGISKSKQNLKHEEDELFGLDLNEMPGNVKISNEVYNPSFLQLPEEDMMRNKGSSSSTKSGSYLLCNRFKVYTSFPDIAFLEGIIVLPISENKWVAVSLEFPNDN